MPPSLSSSPFLPPSGDGRGAGVRFRATQGARRARLEPTPARERRLSPHDIIPLCSLWLVTHADSAASNPICLHPRLVNATKDAQSKGREEQRQREAAFKAKAAAQKRDAAESRRNARLEREAQMLRNQKEAARVRAQQTRVRYDMPR